jgi:Response regulators consisting of a CheY-like receiver domain and a winged-helix DNA-binding domain
MKHLILYAEDDKDMAELYISDLRNGGFEVVWARNGRDAIDLYMEHAPSLLLLDIDIPVLNGFQVAKEIRRKDIDTPIIFLTSFSSSESAVKGFSHGAHDYIRKDISVDEILARIWNVIQRNPITRESVLQITPDTFFDKTANKLVSFNKSYKLSEKDGILLQTLLLYKNIPQKREFVISQVWGHNSNGNDYISKSVTLLRKAMSGDQRIKIVSNRGDSIMITIL